MGANFTRWGNTIRLVLATILVGSTSYAIADNGSVSGDSALEEIVVTAQRHAESIDRVPASITAMTQQDLDDRHIQSFTDLASVVPGLVIPAPGEGSQSSTNVAIRGVISTDNASTTGIYIDETPIVVRQITAAGWSGSPQPDIFDLDRIEVLRGPQGTLLGSGAMGGAIRYITPQPNLDTSSGMAKTEWGYTERGAPSYAVGVAYGAPIIQGEAGFRVSGWFHSDGGFIDLEDPYTGQIVNRNANRTSTYVIRPAFTVVPADGLSITAAVFGQRYHSDAPTEYWATDMPTVERGAYVSGFGAHVPQPIQDNLTVPSLAIKYDFHGLTFQSDSSYTNREYNDYDDYSNLFPTYYGAPAVSPSLASFYSYDKNIVWTHAWQQEFRLSSQDTDARVNWVVGAYYRHALDGVSQFITPDLSPITEMEPYPGCAAPCNSLQYFGVPNFVSQGQVYNSYTYFTTVTDQRALFGDVTIHIVPRLSATVGVRVERSAIQDQKQIFAGPIDNTAYSSIQLADEVQHPVTPKYSLTYQYTNNDMVYVTAAKGYRAGGSNSPIAIDNSLCAPSLAVLGLKSGPQTFDSDSLWSYEIGAKDALFDRRLVLETSVFYIDWTGIQTGVGLPSCGQTFDTNRGKVVSQGFDFQMAAVLTEGLKATANLGYTDTYYPKAEYGTPDPSGSIPPLLVGAGDKVGLVLPWTASATLDYSRDISALWDQARSYFRIDYRWLDGGPQGDPRTSGYVALNPNGATPDSAYSTLNLRLGVIQHGLDISAFVNNATNAEPRLSYAVVAQGASLISATALRPRTMGITAYYRF